MIRQCLLVVFVLFAASKTSIGQSSGSSPSSANASGMHFVRIAPGEFMMGCAADDSSCAAPEKPARRVQITTAFEIGRYEVTQAEWQSVMGSNPSHFRGDNLPVEQVGWNEAQQFLEKLNARNDGYRYRLPTEAEWEFAARGPDNAPAPSRLEDVAWFDANAGRQTHPVGQKQPNARGLHDMLGNVSEWVQDRFQVNYYSTAPSTNPSGPATGENRVMRGGSFVAAREHLRPTYRIQMPPAGSSNPTMGFRYVRIPLN